MTLTWREDFIIKIGELVPLGVSWYRAKNCDMNHLSVTISDLFLISKATTPLFLVMKLSGNVLFRMVTFQGQRAGK